MTRLIYSFVFLFFSAQTFATIRTVSNNPSTVAQFNTIQAAVDASSDGDSIYVHGSPNTYGTVTITDKKVALIGPGWAPDKNLPLQAIITTIILRNSSASGSPSGTEFHGIILTSSFNIQFAAGGDAPVNNLVFRRCQLNGNFGISSFGISGLLMEGCFVSGQFFGSPSVTYENFLFQNNIFFFNVCCISNLFSGFFSCTNVRFDHNLFYSNNSSSSVVQFFGNSRFLTFTNNIFNEANVGAGVEFSSFTNNITNNTTLQNGSSATVASPWTVNSNIDGGNNISNTSPQMAAQAGVDAGNGSPLQDFTIASGPANNAGTDGKDLGLLFENVGSLNWTNSRNSRLPRIVSMNITNPTIAAGATLNVSVNAKSSN